MESAKTVPIWWTILIGLCCFLLGALVVYKAVHQPAQESGRSSDLIEAKAGSKWTSPLLACGDQSGITSGTVYNLQTRVERLIAEHTESGDISNVAVYMRDLRNGPWFAINRDAEFYPASLLKVPLMLAAYRKEEDAPGFLNTPVTYTTQAFTNTTQYFKPEETLTVGQTYTVAELIRHMIVFSDNEAMNLVAQSLDTDYSLRIFSELGIAQPSSGEGFKLTVQTYASFLRILYNASYLNMQHSEEALELLTETKFNEGIEAGIPDDVPVANKFGERRYATDNTAVAEKRQLHDCGIVYAQNPYLICIMAEGTSIPQILEVIKAISKDVYETIGVAHSK